MVKGIFAFLAIAALVAIGIEGFRYMTGRERWEVAKVIGYASLCSLIALVVLSVFVILF